MLQAAKVSFWQAILSEAIINFNCQPIYRFIFLQEEVTGKETSNEQTKGQFFGEKERDPVAFRLNNYRDLMGGKPLLQPLIEFGQFLLVPKSVLFCCWAQDVGLNK